MARHLLKLASVVLLVTFGWVANGYSQAAASADAATKRVAILDLKKKIDGGEKFLLIDVREDEELEKDGAIDGAIHIPMGDLDARMKDIPKDVDIVFYWAGGGRAARAAEKFQKAGFKAGEFCGIRDWKAEGLSVVDKSKVQRPAAGKIEVKARPKNDPKKK